MKSAISLALLATLAIPASAQEKPATPYQRAIAAGYKAAMLCSGVFNAGRTQKQIEAVELRGIYPEYDAIVPTLAANIDRRLATVTVAFDPALPPRRAMWRDKVGCVTMPIGAVAPVWVVIHEPPPTVAPIDQRPWPLGDSVVQRRPSKEVATAIAGAFDRETYGEGSETVGLLIVQDGAVIAERYGEGFGPLASNRTWSVAKSIAGTLVGIAAAQNGIDPAETAKIPEWNFHSSKDARKRITIDHLLRMASGLHGETAGNRTDAVYFGGTSVTEQAPSLSIEANPGTRFRYANNDTLLAVRSLRATIGDDRQPHYPIEKLFAPLGMTHTVAETDWQGNYILSSQVWSTARDLARLGQFWLDDGVWQGKRLLPEGWMRYMTTPSGPQPADGPGYGATLWLFGLKQGLPEGSYAAQGNRGQYVMVIPSKRLVIVRRGEDPGRARFDIARFAADVATAVR